MIYFMIFVALVVIWFGLAFALIIFDFNSIPIFSNLRLPASWDELGDSLGVLNGLFNSIAILLGLLALYQQGRQINESIAQQKINNEINSKTTMLDFYLREVDRLEDQIKELKSNNEYNKELFQNMVNKQKRYRDKANKLADELGSQLK